MSFVHKGTNFPWFNLIFETVELGCYTLAHIDTQLESTRSLEFKIIPGQHAQSDDETAVALSRVDNYLPLKLFRS